jgi:AraC-like DNA-binding protein
MSRSGQAPIRSAARQTGPVVGLAASYPDGARIPRHRHAVAQLVYATAGVMTVTTRDGAWVVPPLRAVWVPPRVAHAIRMTGAVEMRTVYLARALCGPLPSVCGVVHVTPLLRELVLRAVAFPKRYAPRGAEARLAAVLVDEIRAAPAVPLHLPQPVDPRALRVARALAENPADPRPLAGFARPAGASVRTLARLFRRETGLSFAAWRQQLRLLRALERLASGEPVTAVALDLGYAGPSAFVAMFRRTLGVSPGRYFRQVGAPNGR